MTQISTQNGANAVQTAGQAVSAIPHPVAQVVGMGLQIGGAIAESNRNKRNVQRQERENEIIRQREDSAIQRQARDMSAVGLNPSTITGNGAPATSTSAPQESQLNGVASAGQSLISADAQRQALDEQTRHNLEIEQQNINNMVSKARYSDFALDLVFDKFATPEEKKAYANNTLAYFAKHPDKLAFASGLGDSWEKDMRLQSDIETRKEQLKLNKQTIDNDMDKFAQTLAQQKAFKDIDTKQFTAQLYQSLQIAVMNNETILTQAREVARHNAKLEDIEDTRLDQSARKILDDEAVQAVQMGFTEWQMTHQDEILKLQKDQFSHSKHMDYAKFIQSCVGMYLQHIGNGKEVLTKFVK